MTKLYFAKEEAYCQESRMYYTLDYIIDPALSTVTHSNGQSLRLRPRTFRLLLLFLERAGDSLSKDEILQHVWSDTVVGEHVIFQSVKEIRQAFAPIDVIKTVPKQGYTWVQEVSTRVVIDTEKVSSTHSKNTQMRSIGIVAISIFVLLLGFIWQFSQTNQRVSGAVIVLPVANQIDDTNLGWVRLGAMDQLIQNLASGQRTGVLHTDYVLEVLSRAKITSRHYSAYDIRDIFRVSGAGLIVESLLEGSQQEYQLHYTLHRPDGSSKGVVLASNVDEAVSELANVIAHKVGLNINEVQPHYQSGFANELIANALLARYDNDMDSMIQLLEAAVASDQDNITAKRLLIETWLKKGQQDKASELLATTLFQLVKLEKPSREHIRLFYFAAVNALRNGHLDSAESYLAKAENKATEINEWLYLAYIFELRGRIAQQNQNYKSAGDAFEQARSYHRILNCPFGEGSSLLNLSALAKEQNQLLKAQQLLKEAMIVIQQRELDTLLHRATQLRNEINESRI